MFLRHVCPVAKNLNFVTQSPISGTVELGGTAMNVTIEITDDRVARFQRQAKARGLTLDRWLLELGDQNAPASATDNPKHTFADVCAKVRGLADDLDFSRDPSPGRDIVL
jgi:hypothetical protein